MDEFRLQMDEDRPAIELPEDTDEAVYITESEFRSNMSHYMELANGEKFVCVYNKHGNCILVAGRGISPPVDKKKVARETVELFRECGIQSFVCPECNEGIVTSDHLICHECDWPFDPEDERFKDGNT